MIITKDNIQLFQVKSESSAKAEQTIDSTNDTVENECNF